VHTLFRQELAAKLRDWQEGRLSSASLHKWASDLYPQNVVYDDWEAHEGDEVSVASVVLQALDNLNSGLAIPEDAPIYLEFLETPTSQYERGLAHFESRLRAINYSERRRSLHNDPLYAPFCGRSA